MELLDSDFQCGCGKLFSQQSALSNHRRKCVKAKRKLSSLLLRAREVWEEKDKKKRLKTLSHETPASRPQQNSSSEAGDSSSMSMSNVGEATVRTSIGSGMAAAPPPAPAANNTRRSTRIRKPSCMLKDKVPHTAIDWGNDENNSQGELAGQSDPSVSKDNSKSPHSKWILKMDADLHLKPKFCTTPDEFGVLRQYYCPFPPYDPSRDSSPKVISDIEQSGTQPARDPSPSKNRCGGVTPSSPPSIFDPFPNKSSFLLAEWYWKGNGKKSRRDFKVLVDTLKDQDFKLEEIRSASWTALDHDLANFHGKDRGANAQFCQETVEDTFSSEQGWHKEEVSLFIPFHRRQSSTGPQEFCAGHFWRKKLCSVIQEKLAGPGFQNFHFEPFDMFVKAGPRTPLQRIYGELYNSPAFIKAHLAIQRPYKSPPNACMLPRYIAALMFSSDETHLTQFGETQLWPLYLQFGNESKYNRCKPSLELTHHVGYFIKVGDDLEDFIRFNTNQQNPSDKLITHCSREVLHEQWKLILDDDFLEAYRHGMVIKCYDGVQRRIFPRIFTLIADYPEKVSLSGIKSMGTHPCPRCLTPLKLVSDIGSVNDRSLRSTSRRTDDKCYRKALEKARNTAYKLRYSISGKKVMDPLNRLSVSPAVNAFSLRLSKHGFDVFKAFLVDLMHEIESGTWKNVFKHILRILFCQGKHLVFELNYRYRQVPTFGLDTIRKFCRNTSSMSRLAARDWEDILQCSIPVLEGLLPEPHNGRVMNLLYLFGLWHGFAKLRMHTDASLQLLDETTSDLGSCLRDFQATTCADYKTTELPKDMYAQARKKKVTSKKPNVHSLPVPSHSEASDTTPLPSHSEASDTTPLPSHSKASDTTPLPSHSETSDTTKTGPDNASDPSKGGETSVPTTDKAKNLNLRTYKFHAMGDYVSTIQEFGTTDSFSTEMGELEHRRSKARYARTNKKSFIKQIARIEHRQSRLKRIRQNLLTQLQPKDREALQTDLEESGSPAMRYHMSKAYSSSEQITRFLQLHSNDPATKNFLNSLKIHVLPRIMKIHHLQQNISIFFENDRIYHHKVIRFNYTSYDLRRAQDSINPQTSQCNIMMLSDPLQDGHGYIYARVIGIFHVNVLCTGIGTTPVSTRLDILWVRWYDHHPPQTATHLDSLSFPHVYGSDAFGFVDPNDVLRAMHAIPRFSSGKKYKASDHPSPLASKNHEEWNEYIVNRFVDRDMLLRYHIGFGIGHRFCSPSSGEDLATPNYSLDNTPSTTTFNPRDTHQEYFSQRVEAPDAQMQDGACEPVPADGWATPNYQTDWTNGYDRDADVGTDEDEDPGDGWSTTDRASNSEDDAKSYDSDDSDNSSEDSFSIQENQILYPSAISHQINADIQS